MRVVDVSAVVATLFFIKRSECVFVFMFMFVCVSVCVRKRERKIGKQA